MLIKSKIRSLIGDFVVKSPTADYKDRILNKQLIKNIIADSDSLFGSLRILATDDYNANQIVTEIERHKDELNVKSTRIVNKPLQYTEPRKGAPIYERSIVLELEPKSTLRSATSILYTGYQDLLRKEVFEGDEKTENVLIDFSSPNIAKPFHFGHLKSTILGNYLSNINKFLGNQVTKLNYIGDWGTQYGLLSLGLNQFGDEVFDHNDPTRSPLRDLLDIYVKANERARSDKSFYEEAKLRFLLMDTEIESEQMEEWRKIKNLTLKELTKSYSRLGIEFDVFEFESDYASKAASIVNRILSRKFARRLEDGVTVVQVEKNHRMLEVPILRSDGASLYITRDVAAAISRKDRFNFDKLLYVVGADQEKHFHCVRQIIKGLGYDWDKQLTHVKMGKVLGMSSRSGNFLLLSDIIDEATRKYIELTKSIPTSKVINENDLDLVGQQLALSALFVYDLRNLRTRHYNFDWDQLMMATSRSGINLQATFARLSSLLRRAAETDLHPFDSADKLDSDAICCEEATNLISFLNELDTCMHSSYWAMDPSYLVNHALNLCKAINRARQSERLMVLGERNESYARTRLSLFASSRLQLEMVIKLIGLRPLDRI